MLKTLKATFSSKFESALDLVLPPLCPVTREAVAQQGDVHPSLWKELNFITPPLCETCGIAFPVASPEQDTTKSLCASCLRSTPQYTKARSLFFYEGKVRDMILSFKHGDKTHLAPIFAGWMMQRFKDDIDSGDTIIPVPVHKKRLIQRRFNQCALIAQHLAKTSGKPCILNNGIVRTKHTPPQSGNMDARKKNVNKAFSVHPSGQVQIKDKKIILIDDVYTTGSTLNACSETLLEYGAQTVTALTIARVIRH